MAWGVLLGGASLAAADTRSAGAPVPPRALQSPPVLRDGLSFHGLPGLIDIPSATSLPSGSLDVAYNDKRDLDVFPGIGEQHGFLFALGLLPRLTLAGRGTVAREGGADVSRDISANAHFLVLEEEPAQWWPGLALGVQDMGGGSQLFSSAYVVASKTILGRVRGTVGYGIGPDVLEGVFGGVEVGVCRHLAIIGEHDSEDLAAGLRFFPLPRQWERWGVPRATVDVVWQEGNDWSVGIGFRIVLGEAKLAAWREREAGRRYQRPEAGAREGTRTKKGRGAAAETETETETETEAAAGAGAGAETEIEAAAGARAETGHGGAAFGVAGAFALEFRPALEASGLGRIESSAPAAAGGGVALASLARAAGAGVSARAGPPGEASRGGVVASPAESSRGEDLPLARVAESVKAALVDEGFQNVRVTILEPDSEAATIVVEYENRRYNRDELDGLGVVMGLAATHTPRRIGRMRVITREVDIPVLQSDCGIDDFLDWIDERMPTSEFAGELEITHSTRVPAPGEGIGTSVGHPSWLEVDVILEPGIETKILTDVSVAEMRFTFLPDARVQLTPGTVVDVRGRIPVTQTEGFYPGDLGDPELDRALLHQAFPLPLGSWGASAAAIAQLDFGRFDPDRVGIAGEAALVMLDGWLLLKGTVGRVGPSFSELEEWVALAGGRIRYPRWDAALGVTAGLFLQEDAGVDIDLSRFFGNTEIGVFLRHSERGSLAGIRLAVPLTPARELPPLYLRPRLPEVFRYEQRTTVFTNRNVVREDIARKLETDHEIERIYWNRDRLYPALIRSHLGRIRQAVKRWVEPNAELEETSR